MKFRPKTGANKRRATSSSTYDNDVLNDILGSDGRRGGGRSGRNGRSGGASGGGSSGSGIGNGIGGGLGSGFGGIGIVAGGGDLECGEIGDDGIVGFGGIGGFGMRHGFGKKCVCCLPREKLSVVKTGGKSSTSAKASAKAKSGGSAGSGVGDGGIFENEMVEENEDIDAEQNEGVDGGMGEMDIVEMEQDTRADMDVVEVEPIDMESMKQDMKFAIADTKQDDTKQAVDTDMTQDIEDKNGVVDTNSASSSSRAFADTHVASTTTTKDRDPESRRLGEEDNAMGNGVTTPGIDITAPSSRVEDGIGYVEGVRVNDIERKPPDDDDFQSPRAVNHLML